jgi:hypothetical protein
MMIMNVVVVVVVVLMITHVIYFILLCTSYLLKYLLTFLTCTLFVQFYQFTVS